MLLPQGRVSRFWRKTLQTGQLPHDDAASGPIAFDPRSKWRNVSERLLGISDPHRTLAIDGIK
jgi:hypothetical protein